MDPLHVDVERLRPLVGSAIHYIGFLDLQALLGMDFYTARKAMLVLRDAGIVDRFSRGSAKPEYMLTYVGERALALGGGCANVNITGSMVDLVNEVAAAVNLSVASLTVNQGGCAALAITLSLRAGRDSTLDDRVRRLVERLGQRAALPPLRLALAEEARAAGGGEG